MPGPPYVMLGQRGPSTAVAILWIAWLCLRRRTLDPLIRFGTALLLLNLSVGVVKIATGRWGPRVTAHARDVLAGGDIYPSGHTSNAVVLFGVLAVLATRHRGKMIALAVWVSLTVGLSTLYLDTHWVTDVVGGWLAGGLVLLVLPRCAQAIETRLQRADALFGARVQRLRRLHWPMSRPRKAGGSDGIHKPRVEVRDSHGRRDTDTPQGKCSTVG